MKKIKVGWIGLGNMGLPMAANIAKGGYELCVYNRTEAKAQPLVEMGAYQVFTLQELVDYADVIITMVSDDVAVRSIFERTDGIFHCNGVAGKLVVDMSTVSPDTTHYLSDRAKALGIRYLDAPVSGSVKPAQDGQLVILVGGEKSDYTAMMPIFELLGKLALHLGPNGAGNSAKLAINLMLAFYFEGMAEMLIFAEKKGISSADMMAILNEGAMGCGLSRIKTNALVTSDFRAAFALKHLAKDLRLAKDQGLSTNAGSTIEENFRAASCAGLGDLDSAAIVKFLKDRM
jgi:3-hydroxyisobutyrate dehydrogenase